MTTRQGTAGHGAARSDDGDGIGDAYDECEPRIPRQGCGVPEQSC